jgi:hypothetical protein
MEKSNQILVTRVDKIFIINADSFKKVGEIPITLLKTETREPNQILAMAKSLDESYLAVVSGKNLVMKQQKVNQLFVFRKDDQGDFQLNKRVVLKDYPEFEKVCMQFFFREGDLEPGKEPHQIIFVKATKILQVNFNLEGDEVLETLRELKTPLKR